MKRISSRLGSFLLDWLVDYGHHPRQAGRNIKGAAPVPLLDPLRGDRRFEAFVVKVFAPKNASLP